jgi:integrase/recombinase XerD
MQGKQAKIVSPTQERAMVGYLDTTRYPHRDRVMFLLSMKAGLRAKEIASLTWAMVTDAAGQIGEAIQVQNRASKDKTGGRTIPMHPEVQAALVALQPWRGDAAGPDRPVLFSERGGGLSPATVRLWLHRLYTSLKMDGCSSHSGRRTFITRAARKVSQVGGSLRDVQELADKLSMPPGLLLATVGRRGGAPAARTSTSARVPGRAAHSVSTARNVSHFVPRKNSLRSAASPLQPHAPPTTVHIDSWQSFPYDTPRSVSIDARSPDATLRSRHPRTSSLVHMGAAADGPQSRSNA